MEQRLLDVGQEQRSAMRRRHAQLDSEGAIEIERRDGGIADVDHEIVGLGELAAEIPHRGGLSDAGFRVDDAETGLLGEPAKGALETFVGGGLFEEGLALGVLRDRLALETKALSVLHDSSSSSRARLRS